MPEPTTHTVDVPGATVTYDIRSNDATTEPILLLIGSPMGAAGFGTLAGHFTDRTVVTYDPRGVERSHKVDDTAESTPLEHADDLHRVISALGAGPVDVFASSGGAVNALALVAQYPDDVRILVAHEPPIATLVPDSAAALAAAEDIAKTYRTGGLGPAMAKFIALVSYEGEIPANYVDQPGPDPAMFGLPTTDDGSRNDPLMQNMITCTHYRPDIAALKAAPTRVIIAVGEKSSGALAGRGGRAVAERLGEPPVAFPGDHGGFLGGEYGQVGDPDAFAARLREVLVAAT